MKKFTLLFIGIVAILCFASSCSNKSVQLRILKKEVKKNPQSAQSHNNLAFFYEETLGDCEKAIEEYKISLQIKPDGNLIASNNIAQCNYKLKRYDEALKIFEQLVKDYPNNSRIHGNLAMTYHQLGRYEDAEHEYKKALELNPNNEPAKNGYEIFKEDIKTKKIGTEGKGTE
ncbi:MAG: tetratricopeptide repeat protein [bacterium]